MADRIDQFESVFRAAEKSRYVYSRPELNRVVVLVDTPVAQGQDYARSVRGFLEASDIEPGEFQLFGSESFTTIQEMLEVVQAASPGLIVTHRHLHLNREELKYSLGAYLDTLTQGTIFPVLVTPSPGVDGKPAELEVAKDVLVMTDHLMDDPRSINYGVRFVAPGGVVHLCHIEDDAVFQRYMSVIERIPEIETAEARATIRAKLLQMPADYIQSCAEVLASASIPARVNSVVRLGHRVHDYHDLIKEHAGDLLVCNTKDAEELVIHPMAYAIALEFRHQPLLLL
jgi:hypothetical protein